MRLIRFSALLAVLVVTLFTAQSNAAQAAPTTYFCMCYCAGGTIVCVEDTSPACNVCATACQGAGSGEM